MQLDKGIPFVALLRRLQQEAGAVDKAFGRRVGVTEGGWNHVKHGRRQPGLKVIASAFASYPDHHLELAEALARSGLAYTADDEPLEAVAAA